MLFGLEHVRPVVEQLISENPDRKNPRASKGGFCLYTSETDPTDHCIVGQLLDDLKLDVPDSSIIAGFSEIAATSSFTDEAVVWLDQVQQIADGRDALWGAVDLERIEQLLSDE